MASTHATNLSQMKAPPMQPTILERPLNEEYDPMPNPNKQNQGKQHSYFMDRNMSFMANSPAGTKDMGSGKVLF